MDGMKTKKQITEFLELAQESLELTQEMNQSEATKDVELLHVTQIDVLKWVLGLKK